MIIETTVEIVLNTSSLVRETGAKDIEDGVIVGTNAGIVEGALAGHQTMTMPEKVLGAILGLVNLWKRRARI
jgi:hypothetical protein